MIGKRSGPHQRLFARPTGTRRGAASAIVTGGGQLSGGDGRASSRRIARGDARSSAVVGALEPARETWWGHDANRAGCAGHRLRCLSYAGGHNRERFGSRSAADYGRAAVRSEDRCDAEGLCTIHRRQVRHLRPIARPDGDRASPELVHHQFREALSLRQMLKKIVFLE